MDGTTPESLPRLPRSSIIILAVFAAICCVVIPGIGRLTHDDDVLAFLPPDHPDVEAFEAVAERFGMLDVALVGLSAAGEDLLTPARAEQIRELGQSVAAQPGVRLVLAYPDLPNANVRGETLVVDPLVPKGLADPAEIRSRVLSNENAVGSLVSADGRAAALLVYLMNRSGSSERTISLGGIRRVVAKGWAGEAHFGGAPFMEAEAARASREDIERLSPVVMLVLALASALLLGSVTAAILNLLVTGLGVGLVVGAHGWLGEPLTIVSGTTPVMMVALGGAFGMHVIAGYQRQTGHSARRARSVVRELGLPVVLSGVTTATAFFALVVMPQVPMQRFGVVAGIGVLLLLVLALVVLPAILAILPPHWLAHRGERQLALRWRPSLAALLVVALCGGGLALRLRAETDTRELFGEDSEPNRSDRFFAEQFGGSQFVQIAVDGDLGEPAVLRTIRDMAEAAAALPGVVEVRSVVGPVRTLTEGFGGRAGLPETPEQGRRVITNLADQAPMAQLMTRDARGAIVHVKLAAETDVHGVTAAIRKLVASAPHPELRVASTRDPRLAAVRDAYVARRLSASVDREVSIATVRAVARPDLSDAGLVRELEGLRERAFASDEIFAEALPVSEYESLAVGDLVALRGQELERRIAERVPTAASTDPEGVAIAAEQLGQWATEVIAERGVASLCRSLGLASPSVPIAVPADTPEDLELEPARSDACRDAAAIVAEATDEHWRVPDGHDVSDARVLAFSASVTGAPVVGEAFAASVTRSLVMSTLASIVALGFVLLMARMLRAIVPALWTLAVTAGVIALIGHPISIASSMVSCIALGAGVDFAIHLGVRARKLGGPRAGSLAVEELGAVVLITGLELALAFAVLLASQMPTLRQFGVGLAAGLLFAAVGAIAWSGPLYDRGPRANRD